MSINLIFTVLAFSIIFDLAFTMMAERSLKFKDALTVVPDKMKGKFFYKWLISLPFIVLIGFISLLLGANQWLFGILIGFGIALFDVLFRPTDAEMPLRKKENTLEPNKKTNNNKKSKSKKKKKKKK